VTKKTHMMEAHFSDAEMKIFLWILEHYKETQNEYLGYYIESFAPERLLHLAQQVINAHENSAAEMPVRTTDKDWISIKREAGGYHLRAASSFSILSSTILGAHSSDPADEIYSKALSGVKTGFKAIEISLNDLAQLKL
jgi:hypothetical protein